MYPPSKRVDKVTGSMGQSRIGLYGDSSQFVGSQGVIERDV